MQGGTSKTNIALMLAILLLILPPVGFILTNRPRVPALNMPTPNAYDTLAAAGKSVAAVPDVDLSETTDVAVLTRFVADNAQATKLILKAMDEDCVVPIDYDGGFQKLLDESSSWRNALRVLRAEMRLAELEDRRNDQAMLAARMLVISSKLANEGLLTHMLSAAAYERQSLTQLKQASGALTPQQKQAVLEIVDSANRPARDFDAVMEREATFYKKEHGTVMGTYTLWLTRDIPNDALVKAKQGDAEVMGLRDEVGRLLSE